MHIVTYVSETGPRSGVRVGDYVVDLQFGAEELLEQGLPRSVLALLRRGPGALDIARRVAERAAAALEEDPDLLLARGVTLRSAAVDFLAPLPRPGKIVCLGLNYREHAAEGQREPPAYPMLFHKTTNGVIGDGGTIVVPPITNQVDFEAELAVVIGRTARRVTADEALATVAGYMAANDVSARDLQRRTGQFTTGKMVDTFCPLGPALVTADEIADPNELDIELRLNGEVMQRDNTRQMIFDVPFIIAYISSFATLEPGDVILTGTPSGVGFARTPPRFLQPGDEVVVEIERIGRLRNTVAAEA